MRGLRDRIKRRAVFNYCRERCDIAFLQETHSDVENEYLWNAEWGGKIYYNHGLPASRGVCILISPTMGNPTQITWSDKEGRLLSCEMSIEQERITLINIYAPNSDTPDFFNKVDRMLEKVEYPTIIAGDYNLVQNVEIDRNKSMANNNKSLQILKQIMNKYKLEDLWRVRNPLEKFYSWRREGPPLAASR